MSNCTQSYIIVLVFIMVNIFIQVSPLGGARCCIASILLEHQTESLSELQPHSELGAARKNVAFNPKDVQALMTLSKLALEAHQEDEAIRAASQASALQPQDIDVKSILITSLIRNGQFVRGLEVFEKTKWLSSEVSCDNLNDVVEAGRLVAQAQVQIATGDKVRDQNNFRTAVKLLNKALKIDPENFHIRKMLGWIYVEKLGDFDLAYPHLDVYCAHYPDDSSCKQLFAQASSHTGQYTQAIALYREILFVESDNFWIKTKLAQTLNWSGRYEEAQSLFQEVLDIKPDYEPAQTGLEELHRTYAPSVTINSYFFKDSVDFTQRNTSVSYRTSIWDKTHIEALIRYWDFEQQKDNHFERIDAGITLERRLADSFEVHFGFLGYDYDRTEGEIALTTDLIFEPKTDFNLYLSYTNGKPVVDSINTIQKNFSKDVYAGGFNIKLCGDWSAQGLAELADYADGNHRRFWYVQLSDRSCSSPEVYIRLRYEMLDFRDEDKLYFSPSEFQVIRPIVDTVYPLSEWLQIHMGIEVPYVVSERELGHGLDVGGILKVAENLELQASYLDRRFPAAESWSGRGFRISGVYRF
jgi:tetratricopeptide (TPR) repeat protein